MLTIHDGGDLHRRAFLQIGGLALGGLTLPGLLAARALAAERKHFVTDKSVIFLFLHGGPSQIETFDPKMSAPAEVRSATGETATRLPGVTFGASFPKLAALADKLAVVRSYVPGDAAHDIKPVVCRDTFGANLGSVYARMAGANNAANGLPTNVILYPRSVDPSTQAGTMNFGKFGAVGPFGSACAPFDPSGGGDLRQDLRLTLPLAQLEDRRRLLSQLDQVKRGLADVGALEEMDRTRAQAFDAVLGGAADAFDLSKEPGSVVARYDTAPLVRPENIDKKWKNYNNYVDNAKSLGRLLLLARRLCERGCGFVTVTTNFVWDMHADVNNAPVAEGMRYMAPPLDHAVSAFVEDVAARGLSERILLVACGEMGRTPKLNKNGGRDHWGDLGPLLLAGGGLKMGQVIGQSNRDASQPLSEPVRIQNLLATIMHTLFDMGAVRLVPGAPREIAQTMTDYEPIRALLS
ncbi:MAG TPA: DUF1501 domain-containing protein [Planctomycetales bacterium]|jgi:uncharacterized protein (DUF1501 family)|nr:DUF1501 domain-containing protein [Planctomycetales bacterium]